MTPRRRSSPVNCATMLYAPRILKAPPGCRLSHFSNSDCSACGETSSRGVTRAIEATRFAAERMSSSVIKSVISLTSRRSYTPAESCGAGVAHHDYTRGEEHHGIVEPRMETEEITRSGHRHYRRLERHWTRHRSHGCSARRSSRADVAERARSSCRRAGD